MLRRPNFNVDNVDAPRNVKAFLYNLHRVAVNAVVNIGTKESKTDTLINNILTRVIDFQEWPLTIRLAIIENAFACYIFNDFLCSQSYLT
jgi:hypothetical protein